MEITSVSEEMDLSKWLPDLDGIQSGLTGWVRALVMIGPVIMLLLGLYYFFLAPKEANYTAGYRFRYAMSRVGVWQFAQRTAGIAYGGLGLLLTVIMLFNIIGFGGLSTPDLVWRAAKCVLWQIILALIVTLAVDILIVLRYDSIGRLRKRKKKAARKRVPARAKK